MRTRISIAGSSADPHRLKALIRKCNAPQSHVWRAPIVLPTATGVGTNEILREPECPKLRLALAGLLRAVER